MDTIKTSQKKVKQNITKCKSENLPQVFRHDNFDKHPTDLGNARRLVKQFGEKIRFCPEYDRWLIWTGQRWEFDSRQNTKLIKYTKEVVKSIYSECAKLENDQDRKELSKWARQSEARKRLVDMIFLAQSEDGIDISEKALDHDAYLLNCQNGMIDLKTGALKPHDPKYHLTKMIPVTYDPEAECVQWEEFLFKIMDGFQDAERALRMMNFLQCAIGYTLTGDISEQCLFFLYGTGENGKSVFTNTIVALLGDYFQHVRIESLLMRRYDAIPNDLAKLPGARLVVSSEIPESRKMNESLVKDLTGGDAITARFMREEEFTFHPVFKLWIFGNYKPIISPDDAIFRRIKLIPFTVKIPKEEQIPQAKLEGMLKAELPGILTWAVKGCLKWQQEGLETPLEVINATNEYREEMDILSDFLEECCTINSVAKVKKSFFYNGFQEWCHAAGIKPLGKRTFSTRLKRRLPELQEGRGTGNEHYWFGIGLMSGEQAYIQ